MAVNPKSIEQARKNKREFTSETAREAQKKGVEKRRANQILLDAFTHELALKAQGENITQGQKIIKNVVEGAADGDIGKQKLVFTYALSNEPKETQVISDDKGIRIVTTGATQSIIEDICRPGE